MDPGFAQKVMEEVNKIRLNPKTYSNKIRGYLSYFQGNVLRIPKQPGLMTNEGSSAYKEAADFLLSLPKLQPLKPDSALTSAAEEMAEELGHCQEFEQMDSIDREGIINKYGQYEGTFGESTDFGSLTPEMVVINLLVDDGNKSRSNRKMLFKESYRKIGCGCVPHDKFKSVTVIMYATNFISGGGNPKIVKTNKTALGYGSGQGESGYYNTYEEREGGGNIKEIRTEQDIKNSGIPYRYVNNVDPNQDLITDSAKYDRPLNISKVGKSTNNFKEEKNQKGTRAENPNYRQKLNLKGKGETKVGGGGSILNTNEESSGWAPSLQKNYKPPEPEEENNYMSRVGKNTKTTKVGGGGSILNTNVESSGWTTDFEKQKSPEYWKAKQEYQDNYRGMAPIGPAVGNIGGGGPIGNTNVESTDWNDYSGYDRRMPLYHEEKRYEAPSKEERDYEYEQPQQERGYGYGQKSGIKNDDEGFPDMEGVTKFEKSEKIINENGKQIKLTKLVKYMENGEIKTEITKTKI